MRCKSASRLLVNAHVFISGWRKPILLITTWLATFRIRAASRARIRWASHKILTIGPRPIDEPAKNMGPTSHRDRWWNCIDGEIPAFRTCEGLVLETVGSTAARGEKCTCRAYFELQILKTGFSTQWLWAENCCAINQAAEDCKYQRVSFLSQFQMRFTEFWRISEKFSSVVRDAVFVEKGETNEFFNHRELKQTVHADRAAESVSSGY